MMRALKAIDRNSKNGKPRTRAITPASRAAWQTTVEKLETRTLFSTHVVTTTADSGFGSLRQAILDANTSPGVADTITFNISGSGVQTIVPLSPLPKIMDVLVLDGTSQPGYVGSPLVEINGASGAGGIGLEVDSACTIEGLAINGFSNVGIHVGMGGDGATLQANYVGTDATGMTANPNGTGILVDVGSVSVVGNLISGNSVDGLDVTGSGVHIAGNLVGTEITGAAALGNGNYGIDITGASATIGGTTPGARNIISGNGIDGITFSGVVGGLVEGNYIGTDSTGASALPNSGNGVSIISSSGVSIGAAVAGAGNLISANLGDGVYFDSSTNCTVAGNFIGTDATGSHITDGANALGNSGSDIYFDTNSSGNVIGGNTPAARNLISGSAGNGITLGSTDSANTIQGNYIGTDATGLAALPNQGNGIDISSSGNSVLGNLVSGNMGFGVSLASDSNSVTGNLIGADSTGTSALPNVGNGVYITGNSNSVLSNTISYNGGAGVTVFSGTSNTIRQNSSYMNAQLAIDLGGDGVTTDVGPSGHAGGPNLFQNFPDNLAAVTSSGQITITGTLDLTPGAPFTIDFYSSAAPDPSGYGQGQNWLGSATVKPDGTFTATFAAPASGQGYVSATATDSSGNTSEFSRTVAVTKAKATLGGHVFNDIVGDGLTPDDTPLAGVVVRLYLESDHNSVLDSGDGAPIATTTSDPNGLYTFTNLAPGTYYVQEIAPSGYVRTAPSQSAYFTNTAVAGTTITTDDFDNFKVPTNKSAVTNISYNDTSATGTKSTFTDLRGHTKNGDTITVNFTVLKGNSVTLSFVTYTTSGTGQQVYQSVTQTFTAGASNLSASLTIKTPPAGHYQIDFVLGSVIAQQGPAGSNISYLAENRLFSVDNE
jgi:SdrD B-like domain/Right handed beta helix region